MALHVIYFTFKLIEWCNRINVECVSYVLLFTACGVYKASIKPHWLSVKDHAAAYRDQMWVAWVLRLCVTHMISLSPWMISWIVEVNTYPHRAGYSYYGGGGCLPWFFFQTAEEPGGELGADAGDLVCVWCWPWVSGGSRAAAGPARLGDRGRSEALFLRWSWGAASARCSGAWAGRVSWLEKKGGPRRGGAAESGWGTAAWKELSGLGIWKGSSWGLDTESNRGGFWSMATGVMFRLVAAAGRGGTGSVDFVLPRGTLEQVCRWVRRPR